jgi:DNA-binding CsgD family transcriptional regulator
MPGIRGLERDVDSYTDSELSFGRIVLPVLEDFEETRVLLGEAEKRARALVILPDRLPVGALVLAADGRLLAMNRAARTLLGGVTTRMLEAAQKAARSGEEVETRVVIGEKEAPLRLVPADLSEGEQVTTDPMRPNVVFVVRTDVPPVINSAAIANRCHLSHAEGKVVGLVAQGSSNEEIAARLKISVETVRSHLASAYRKTGARNRAALVALAFCAPYGHGPFSGAARDSA